MRSIDNLREWWRDRFPVMDRQLGCDFREHIDAIEFEVKALVDERDLLKTQWEAGVDFDQRLEACADNREDVTLWGVDYTPLPVDADGEPWHINDEFEVDEGIAHVNGIGDNRLYYIDNDGMQWTRADNKRHHHAPTVEDVLTEMVAKVIDRGELTNGAAQTIAEYAAKLTLRGDE